MLLPTLLEFTVVFTYDALPTAARFLGQSSLPLLPPPPPPPPPLSLLVIEICLSAKYTLRIVLWHDPQIGDVLDVLAVLLGLMEGVHPCSKEIPGVQN